MWQSVVLTIYFIRLAPSWISSLVWLTVQVLIPAHSRQHRTTEQGTHAPLLPEVTLAVPAAGSRAVPIKLISQQKKPQLSVWQASESKTASVIHWSPLDTCYSTALCMLSALDVLS